MKKINENKIFFIIIAVLITSFIYFLSIYIILTYFGQSVETDTIIKNVTEQKLVTKIIDGDTLLVEGGSSVRLLGIDADEKGYPCYESAKQRLEELVLNRKVYLEADGEDQDQYKRYLRYIFLNNENINLKLVKEGLAIARFSVENVKYKEEITTAEKYAIENKVGCKWSKEVQLKEHVGSDLTSSIEACDAGNYIGEEKIVKGKIVGASKSGTNTVFLNFGKPYPNHCFVAVIFSSDLINFPENPQIYYNGKIVSIKGIIKEYNGKPEIILKYGSQIEIKNE